MFDKRENVSIFGGFAKRTTCCRSGAAKFYENFCSKNKFSNWIIVVYVLLKVWHMFVTKSTKSITRKKSRKRICFLFVEKVSWCFGKKILKILLMKLRVLFSSSDSCCCLSEWVSECPPKKASPKVPSLCGFCVFFKKKVMHKLCFCLASLARAESLLLFYAHTNKKERVALHHHPR